MSRAMARYGESPRGVSGAGGMSGRAGNPALRTPFAREPATECIA